MNDHTTPLDPPERPLDKETIRLPDGRELTYYRFPDEPSAPAPRSAPAGAKKKER